MVTIKITGLFNDVFTDYEDKVDSVTLTISEHDYEIIKEKYKDSETKVELILKS